MGTPINKISDEMSERWKKAKNILVGFGAPSKGLYDIASDEKMSLAKISDYIINTIPKQGTETVRTEEAIYATLAILNMIEK
jgi:predicted SPOUT superfamily RNA methylase MTH1